MIPQNIIDKAHAYLNCPHDSITIEDAYRINPTDHRLAIFCPLCGRGKIMPISRREYKSIDFNDQREMPYIWHE